MTSCNVRGLLGCKLTHGSACCFGALSAVDIGPFNTMHPRACPCARL